MTSLLIVDDQEGMRRSLAMVLRKEGFDVRAEGDARRALVVVAEDRPDIVVTDLRMEPLSGLDLLRAIKQASPATEVILMTAFATIDSAVEAMRLGAFDYVMKPFRNEEIVYKIMQAVEKRALPRPAAARRPARPDADLVGESAAMRAVLARVAQIAPSDLTVLITGETGTGKTAVARAIHAASPRGRRGFVHLNCAALPETLLESELFGHERGAFTGAAVSRPGLFEEADGGTLFLDEIALLPTTLQAKLLTVLEDRVVRRLGSNRSVPVDIRILAATNADLDRARARGEFRSDLFYRLKVATLHLPPLRERRDEIMPLAGRFLDALTQRLGRRLVLAPDALATLAAYDWPGNVRELDNVIKLAATMAPGERIGLEHLPEELRGRPAPPPEEGTTSLAVVEHQVIIAAIRQHNGNLTRVARALGIGRTTLWRRMREYGLEPIER